MDETGTWVSDWSSGRGNFWAPAAGGALQWAGGQHCCSGRCSACAVVHQQKHNAASYHITMSFVFFIVVTG